MIYSKSDAEILSQQEGKPTSRPVLPGTANVTSDMLWDRLEPWLEYRWGERNVVWVIRGLGLWGPSLRPTTIDNAEVWCAWGRSWQPVELVPGPIGYEINGMTYRITATVGDTDAPPDIVLEAARRLAGYLDQAGADPAQGHTSGTDGDYSFTRPAGWAARAIHLSGAADLLRTFR